MKTEEFVLKILQRRNGRKVIVIVGAGVSTEVGLMTGRQIVQEIYAGKYGAAVREALLDRKTDDFLQVMATYRNAVIDAEGKAAFNRQLEIWMGYPENNSPLRAISESYELLAHLQHHNVIDAIVSLNFDEFLDEAIRLEAHPETVHEAKIDFPIVGDSQFARFNDMVDAHGLDKLGVPLYLKPHGTIGKHDTIRLSPAKVGKLSEPKTKALETLFDDAIVIGLGWRGHDFGLLNPLKNAYKVVVVRPTRNPQHDPDTPKVSYINKTANRFLRRVMDVRATAATRNTQLKQSWLGPLRHLIRGAFFGCRPHPILNGSYVQPPLLEATTENQMALEVLIHICKARGYAKSTAMTDCRRIRYLALKSRKKNSLRNVLQTLVDNKVLDEGTMPITGDQIYVLHTKWPKESMNEESLLASVTQEALGNWCASHGVSESPDRERAIDYLVKLGNTFDIDVKENPRQLAVFNHGVALKSRRGLIAATNDLLKRRSTPCHLFVSAYTGEWLQSYLDLFDSRSIVKVTLIAEDFSIYKEQNAELYARVAEYKIRELVDAVASKPRGFEFELALSSPKVHNMSVLRNARNGRILDAIYFERRSKTPVVSPIRLRNPARADRKQLNRFWRAHSTRAKPIPSSPSGFRAHSAAVFDPMLSPNLH